MNQHWRWLQRCWLASWKTGNAQERSMHQGGDDFPLPNWFLWIFTKMESRTHNHRQLRKCWWWWSHASFALLACVSSETHPFFFLKKVCHSKTLIQWLHTQWQGNIWINQSDVNLCIYCQTFFISHFLTQQSQPGLVWRVPLRNLWRMHIPRLSTPNVFVHMVKTEQKKIVWLSK